MINLLRRFDRDAPRPPVGVLISLRVSDHIGEFDTAPVKLTDPEEYRWGNGYTLESISLPLDACLIVQGWRYVEERNPQND
jgi:hypothetical protein